VLYLIIKRLVNVFFRVYYRIDYTGIEKLPLNKPVVLAPNHVNAFIDPIIIAMLPSQKVRFFARGDVFKTKMARFFLEKFNISPMWRIQEGYSELKKNDKTFEECRRLLTSNKTILIFPEGICIQEKRLRPLKKGLARIVFQTTQSTDYTQEIFVLPVGLNYEDANKFRSKVFIHFGEPVSTKDYIEKFKSDPVKTINEFTKHLEARMKQYMVIVNNPANDVFADNLCEMFTKDWLKEQQKNPQKLINEYHATSEIFGVVNYYDEKNKPELESIRENVLAYFKKLSQYELRDHLLHPDSINASNTGTFILEFFKLYLGFPIYLIGLLMNYPPYVVSKIVSDKKVNEIEFYASVYANMAMVLWLIYYFLQLLFVALIFKNWILLGMYFVLVPLTGYFVLQFYPMMQKILGRWRLLRLVRKNKNAVQELMNNRNEIVMQFNEMKSAYKKI